MFQVSRSCLKIVRLLSSRHARAGGHPENARETLDSRPRGHGRKRNIRIEYGFVIPSGYFIAVALLCTGCGISAGKIDPTDKAKVARGETVYGQQCASCHGANLEGQPEWRIRKPNGRLPAPPHDVSGHTWHHPTSVLLEIVNDGLVPPNAPEGYESDMPAFRNILPGEDIVAVLSFIQSRWDDEVRAFRRENKLDVE
jgi:mono/diheme cytochrome c family protein